MNADALADMELDQIQGLPSRIYEVLKSKILTCELQPGLKLQEKDLSDALRVSRTPLREALNRLALERLVELKPYRGYRVAPVRAQDIQNLCEMRWIVETETAALAAERATEEDVEALLSVSELPYEPGNTSTYLEYLSYNRRFHQTLARCSRNERLETTVAFVLDQIQRPLYLALDIGLNAQAATAEHLELVKAVRNHDPDLARKVMKDQLCAAAKRVETVVSEP